MEALLKATENLGPCCACLEAPARNVILLDLRAPRPGTGWGCVVCNLKFDGAIAVLCDSCLDRDAKIIFAVDGYITNQKRIKLDELTEPFTHDMSLHQMDGNTELEEEEEML